jgi:hypothetical protein
MCKATKMSKVVTDTKMFKWRQNVQLATTDTKEIPSNSGLLVKYWCCNAAGCIQTNYEMALVILLHQQVEQKQWQQRKPSTIVCVSGVAETSCENRIKTHTHKNAEPSRLIMAMRETEDGSEVLTRKWSKATVTLDCKKAWTSISPPPSPLQINNLITENQPRCNFHIWRNRRNRRWLSLR